MSRFLFVVNRVAAQKATYSTTCLMAALVRQGCAVWATDLVHLSWDSTRNTVARAWRLPDWARQPFAVCRALQEAGDAAAMERHAQRISHSPLPGEGAAGSSAGGPAGAADSNPIDAFEDEALILPGADEALPAAGTPAATPAMSPPPISSIGLKSPEAGEPQKPQGPSGQWQPLPADAVDAAWLRCNLHAVQAPGNPMLAWAQAFEAAGKICFNSPSGLWRTSDKTHLFDLPAELRPRGLLSSNRADLLACIRFLGRTVVLKPVGGFGGEQVFIVERGRFDNLNAILDTLLAQGPVLVQEYLAAAADGDRRVLLWQGHPLEIDGHTTIYRRMRPPGDLRNNLHIGGIRARCRYNRNDEAVIEGLGDFLRRHGIWLAGVDIIGGKVLEINACAPGGIHNINELYGIAVDDRIAQNACQAVAERLTPGGLRGAG